MAKKDDYRYRIDTLLKIASITSDNFLREDCCMEAKNLIDDIHECMDCVDVFLTKYYEMGINFRTTRSEVFEHYNNVREKEGFPYLTRKRLYARLREHGVGEKQSNGYRSFMLREKSIVLNQEKEN